MDSQEIVESAQQAHETRDAKERRLNATVAVTVALLATFSGICKVKDDNIVQAMQQAQADKIDHWSYYQARNLRQELAEATLTQLQLAQRQATQDPGAYDAAIQQYQALATAQDAKKQALQKQAEDDQRRYDALNYRDDQFDLSDAFLAVAIAMLAVTALTQTWGLYWLALWPTAAGVFMGLAGLLELPFHPDTLVRLLS